MSHTCSLEQWMNLLLNFSEMLKSHPKAVHDYVQWIFPTDEASMFNSQAPLLSPELAAICRHDAQIQKNFDASQHRAKWLIMAYPFFCEVLCFLSKCSMRLVLSVSVVEFFQGPDLGAFSVLFGPSNGGEEDHKSQAFRYTSPGFNSATKVRLKQAMPGYVLSRCPKMSQCF